MKKLFLKAVIFFTFVSSCALAGDIYVKNKYFSIAIPEALKGIYSAKTKKDTILIYDKASKKAGFGGFAFGIKAYSGPSDYANAVGTRKIGELVDKKNNLYDMVLIQPTDVQYDYKTEKIYPYKLLYVLGEIVDIQGIKGSNYYKNQGMKGHDLYKEILQKHVTAIKEKWDSSRLEQEKMSYMYNVLSKTNKNVLDKVGYSYYDVNGDGVDELFIGEIAKDNLKGAAYDVYTMVNRKPIHVISGGAKDRYYACDGAFICREYLSGAKENGWLVYILLNNSTELYPQVGFKYDGYKNAKNPWFISYDFMNDKWDNVSKETFDERKKVFNRYERFNYIPLSSVKLPL